MIQAFADGTTVEWSDLVPYGAPAPRHPALVVPYSDTPAAPDPGAEAAGHHHGAPALDVAVLTGTGSPWWTIGLGVGRGALVAAGSAVLGRRQRRRFTAHSGEARR